ncbi:hypothetical protein GCM10007880_64260 [Mesorhizobium amorphae]|uniref:hypothetical protein n=1 Tax=Mesorhizobium amorphae TaxID=71433 RepID=UPI00235C5546|nr:hypothetical protein [Mesorhizobium amorphae]GLR45908.1 hypothetical protein GCM10007880_64260 [Mesorhizobium amorphae]
MNDLAVQVAVQASIANRKFKTFNGGGRHPAYVKSSDAMNLELHHVVADITGVTGMAIHLCDCGR